MKALIYLMKIGLVLVALFFFSSFVYFLSMPSPPESIVKLGEKDWELDDEVHAINPTLWYEENSTLFFNNQSTDKELVTLYTSDLKSEGKKQGYITSSVTVKADFSQLDEQTILGFQLGEQGEDEANHLLFGINGKGELIVRNGEMNLLEEEQVPPSRTLDLQSNEAVELSFHYYKNPYGWIIFLRAHNGENAIGGHINHIPFAKLNSNDKELSLVVNNPSQTGKVGFQNWTILNDWTPND